MPEKNNQPRASTRNAGNNGSTARTTTLQPYPKIRSLYRSRQFPACTRSNNKNDPNRSSSRPSYWDRRALCVAITNANGND